MPIKIPRPQSVEQPGTTALRVSLGVAQQEAAALGGIGDSLQGAGDQLLAIGQKIRAADESKQTSELLLTQHEKEQEYLQSLENNFDEDQWVPGADQIQQDIQSEAAGLKLSNGARQRLDLQLRKTGAQFKLKVGAAAASQINSRAIEGGLLSAETFIQKNDLAGYEDQIRSLSGLMAPEKIDKLINEGGRKIKKNQILESTMSNAAGTLEALKSGAYDDDVSTSDKRSLIYAATKETNEERREFYNELMLGIVQDKYPSEEQILSWAAEKPPRLSPGQASNMLARTRADNPPPFDAGTYYNLARDIAKYDPSQDDEAKSKGTELAARVATSGLSGSAASKLGTRLTNQLSGSTSAGSIPARVRSEGMDVADWYADQSAFGLVIDSFTGKADPKSQKISDDKKAEIADKYEAFIDRNPDIGYTEAREAMDAIIRPMLQGWGADQILGVADVIEEKDEDQSRTGLELPQQSRIPSNVLFNGSN